jgi:alkylhydroperoxidase family enzyme
MLGLSVGLTGDEMAAMSAPETCASFDEIDKLVLRYSEALTRENRVDDALYAALSARFSTQEILQLCVTIGMSGLVNRVHATFRTDVEESTLAAVADLPACPLPVAKR